MSEKHDISYLEYVNERVGDERFKKLLEFDVGERLKGSILTSYRGSIKEFQFLIQRLSSEELIEHLQNNKNVSSYCDNLIVNMMASGNQEAFDVLTSKLESDGKADDIRTLMLDKDKDGQSGLSYAIEFSANRDRYRGLLESALKFCTAEDLALELKSKNSKLAGMIRSSRLEQEMNRRLELIKSKLGEPLYKDVVEVNAKEIILEMISSKDEQFEKDVIALLGVEKVKESVNRHLDELISPYFISKGTFNLIRKYCSRADLGEKLAKGCAESIKEKMNSSWYSAGSISNVLDSLTPQEYVEFQKQLSLEPDSLGSYFRPEKLQSDKEWQGKIKELLSGPDKILPHVFTFDVLRTVVILNNPAFQIAFQDLSGGINFSIIKGVIDKSDDRLVKFILSPTPSLLFEAIRWRNESEQNFMANLISGGSSEHKKELLSTDVKNIDHGSTLSILLNDFTDDEVYDLFSRVEGKKTALSEKHDISYLEYVNERVGDERFKKLLEFDVGERLKGSILTSYRGSIKEFQFLIQRLSSEELIEHLQNNKNVSSYCDNLIVNMMASGNQEAFDVLTSKLESDGKADDIRTLMLDKDKDGQSGLSYAIEFSANRDRYRGLLESALKFCTAEDLALELKSKNSKLAGMIRSSRLEQEMNRRLELIKSKLGEPLYKDVVEVNAKEIILEMISSKDEQFEKDVIALLGVEKVKESVNRHLDELISPYFISKGTFNLIRKYCSRADLGEKLAKGCAESIKEKMNSSWYSAGSISNVLDSLTPQEYVEFQKQLSLEPDSLGSYFRPEKLQSDKEWQGKIKELLSASDEMVPVVFNESVIKSILRVNLQGTILSKAIDDLTNKPNLNMLLNFMYLTENNPDLTNIVLAPSSQSLEKILTNGVKPPEAFGFCWKNIIFNILTADEIKASLTSDVLTMISNPQMLVDAIQKLSDKEVFVLFNQESCKAVLKQYPDEMLKAVAARIGEKNIEILTQEKIQGKTKPHGKMTHMFEREKDAKPKVSPEQEQGVKEQKKGKLNM
ncbi:MAG: hypothetical protein AB7D28_11480 [Candidatus Berkiella sp.]